MTKDISIQPPFALNETLKQPSVPGLEGFVRLSGEADNVIASLGPLADLIGTWVGNHGWNMIAVPDNRGGDHFDLLIRPFIETITFTPLGAPVPDRGGEVGTLFITGLGYDLRVTDAGTNQPMHIENGMWLLLNQDQSQNPDQPSIARHSVIPHGDSLLALGNYSIIDGAPQFPEVNGIPDPGTNAPSGYTDPYLNPAPGFKPGNVALTLQETSKEQDIVRTTAIEVDTKNNGGILNIPFIVRHANASDFRCFFWIETVKAGTDGTHGQATEFQQLQYLQQTNLNFIPKFDVPRNPKNLITWAHTNVNTLVKQ